MTYLTTFLLVLVALFVVLTLLWEARLVYQTLHSATRGISLLRRASQEAKILDMFPASKKMFKALKLFERHGMIKEQIETWINLGDIYHVSQFADHAFLFYDNAYRLALQHKMPEQIADALNRKGTLTRELGMTDDALTYFGQSLAVLEKTSCDRKRIDTLMSIGFTYGHAEAFKKAERVFDKAATLNAKTIKDQELGHQINLHRAQTAMQAHRYKIALLHAKDSLKVFDASDRSLIHAELLYAAGRILYAQRRFSEAASMLRQLLKFEHDPFSTFTEAGLYALYGAVQMNLGKLASAEKYTLMSLERETEREESFYAATDCCNLCTIYAGMHKPKKEAAMREQLRMHLDKLNDAERSEFDALFK